MHETCRKPIFCPMDKKMITPQINGVLDNLLVCEKMSGKLADIA